LRTARDGDFATVAVCDNGCGITAENRARTFDPFFITKPIGKGTGLGLSIAYGIVAKQGGHVDAESEPGIGATFTVRLPIRRA
jgi:two-component system NtrC family sensor kinase